MRIHTDSIRVSDLNDAARIARVDMEVTTHGSRKRDHAFEVKLTGESRRRPQGGGLDAFAATWDQWGVFFAHLFMVDSNAHMGTAYDGVEEFDYKTSHRFDVEGYWPSDAHGDHRFQYAGIPYTQACTKCTATHRWQ